MSAHAPAADRTRHLQALTAAFSQAATVVEVAAALVENARVALGARAGAGRRRPR